jgi:rhamnogalacturonyl hydrolase YesR
MASILPAISAISTILSNLNVFTYSPGFEIKQVVQQAQALPAYSWEFGTAAEALLELYNPDLSVFGDSPFPVPTVNASSVLALNYAASKVVWGTGYAALASGDGAAGDPASLGVSAVMLGKTNSTFAWAANQTMTGLTQDIPRYWNGAISQRVDYPELWADFMYMVPPFLAYYAADQGHLQLLQDTVQQCELYRQILKANTTAATNGIWMHIIGPQNQATGFWSTGNAWAAAGMTRVLATVTKATSITDEGWRQQAITQLTGYIQEIVDGAMNAPQDGGLLRNYLDDVSGDGIGFGEISGSSLLAATVYRMAVLQPTVFTSSYIVWADSLRGTLAGNDVNGNPHITSTGIATPAVDPMWWKDTTPFTTGSPEGESFVVLMYAGWRDCVKAGICPTSPASSSLEGSSGGRRKCSLASKRSVDALISKREASPLNAHGGLRRRLSSLFHGGSS